MMSNAARVIVSRLPHGGRYMVSQVLAVAVYFPLARGAKLVERLGVDVRNFPLSQYHENSFYTMRTDALDRFGNRIEQRFTKGEIRAMMDRSGLEEIEFSETSFWTAVGFKKCI